MEHYDAVRERLLAYILPRRPQTQAQDDALALAVAAQTEFEEASGLGDLPGGVASVTNDGVSVVFRDGGQNSTGYSRDTLSPTAWSILRNAGLIAYDLPTARRP